MTQILQDIIKADPYHFADFTRDNYRHLLQLAQQSYAFRSYTNFNPQERFVLWRHDVDFSPHGARRLAKIEAEEGIVTTFFFHLHSEFYNLLEQEISDCVRYIIAMGHSIGLHFDTHYYKIQHVEELEQVLQFEKGLLEEIFKQEIRVFSFHNTTPFTMSCQQWQYAGMINTYAEYFQTQVGYCSDSNGYWRFRRLQDVLEMAEDERLQVLTHPAWWIPEPMSPRARVTRCIEGRAIRQHEWYDKLLAHLGRENVQ